MSDQDGDEGEARPEPQQVHNEVRRGLRVEVISGVERNRHDGPTYRGHAREPMMSA